jgi:hypothetical protein
MQSMQDQMNEQVWQEVGGLLLRLCRLLKAGSVIGESTIFASGVELRDEDISVIAIGMTVCTDDF